ncbi:MAG TPA: hypothetical protein ENF73_03930 [Proteobacteria bacterium]|nr:hypothetical protein [Pseudomonadota bacterium]
MKGITTRVLIAALVATLVVGCPSRPDQTLDLKRSWVVLSPPYTTGRAGETISVCLHLRTRKRTPYIPGRVEIFPSSGKLTGKLFRQGDAICQRIEITEPKEVSFAIFVDGKLLKRVPKIRLLDPLDPEKYAESPFAYELAQQFAPIIVQRVGSSPEADRPIPFDFDENLYPYDNWENTALYRGPSTVYFSLVETETHAFIFYFFYYPRHYSLPDRPGFSWENDWSAVMLICDRSGRELIPIAVETATSQGFEQYSFSHSVRPNVEDIEGDAAIWHGRPVIEVSAYDHTPRPLAQPDTERLRQELLSYPSFVLVPEGMDTRSLPAFMHSLIFPYRLQSFFERIWKQKDTIGIGSFEFVRGWKLPELIGGDNITPDRCQPPWAWDDPDDGMVEAGMWLLDPARTVSEHLDLGGEVSLWYTYNPYLGID